MSLVRHCSACSNKSVSIMPLEWWGHSQNKCPPWADASFGECPLGGAYVVGSCKNFIPIYGALLK